MTRIAYLSDVEGQLEKLVTFAEDNPWVQLRDGELAVAPGARFVFGGDAVDRGDGSLQVVAALNAVAARCPDQVVLLAGNRDINKIRLPRELSGHPPPKAPPGLSRPDLLRWILANTMGAREAFEHRRTELGGVGDEDVVDSFLADVARDGAGREGPHLTLLRRCRLAFREGRTLFVHGGVTAESLLRLPDGRTFPDLEAWIRALDGWYADQIDAFAEGRPGLEEPPWAPLVRYQAPVRGSHHNPGSVVYGRNGDVLNNPQLPPPDVRARLRDEGVDRLVVGHTPSGDLPSILRADDGFESIVADPSRSRLPEAPRLLLTDDVTEVRGRVVLDDGSERSARFALRRDELGPIGRRTSAGQLVKAPLGEDEILLFCWRPGYTLEQAAAPRSGHPAASLVAPEA